MHGALPQARAVVLGATLLAWASVPLVSGGRVFGALGLGFGDARDFDAPDRAFADGGPPVRAGAGPRAPVRRGARGPERAEEASRAKDEFLATLSHELRTPLTAILGWAQMLRTRHARPGRSSARALETIERNARAQTQLIEDLLDVCRIVTGKLRLEVQPRGARAAWCEAALEAVRPAADGQGHPARVASWTPRAEPRSRRPGPAAAGGVEPALQRHQVHARRAAA